MSDFGDHVLTDVPRKTRSLRFRLPMYLVVPLTAILFEVYVPRFFPTLKALELPLLVTVYFALMKRDPIKGLFFGAGIGLAEDSFSHQPLGMFGIVNTLIGYFAASVSMRFDVDNPVIQFILGYFFYVFHQFFYWVLDRALLGHMNDFDIQQTFLFGLLNAAVALPLFMILDKMKE